MSTGPRRSMGTAYGAGADEEAPLTGKGADEPRLGMPYWQQVALTTAATLSFGILAFVLPEHSDDPSPWDRISSVLGWWYFAAWSGSFYPQVVLNWQRQSVVGMSFDYYVLNIIGFVCYAIFNVTFYWDADIQADYRATHNGKPNLVRLDDVVFALHAVLLTLVTLYQVAAYDRGTQKVSRTAIGLATVLVITSVGFTLLVWSGLFAPAHGQATGNGGVFTWLNTMYVLSFVKLVVTVTKYVPQVWLNIQRQSTVGYSMGVVAMDFSGGVLSIAQLVIDGTTTHNFEGIVGDPVKFGLGFASMVFDVIFMIQHNFIYTDHRDKDAPAARRRRTVSTSGRLDDGLLSNPVAARDAAAAPAERA